MDTTSGLCTPTRENLDVTTVTDNNGADDIVRIEPQRLGAGSAPAPRRPTSLIWSTQDVVKLADDMGVGARRVHTADELAHARRGAVIQPAPH